MHLETDRYKCCGITQTGKQCCNNSIKDKNYCHLHELQFKYPKPTECPICTDELDTNAQPLSCGHWVHRKCILKWKDECPICRATIKLTKKERSTLFLSVQYTECQTHVGPPDIHL